MLLRGASLVLFALTASAQQPAPGPIIRVGTDLVQVDVVVRDKKGPVEGLAKGDFTLFDNGKQQEISVFSVRSNLRKPVPTVITALAPLPPGVVSNRATGDTGPGAQTVIVLDQKNTSMPDQAFAIQRIAAFLQHRRKNDRIGIYAFGRDGLQSIQELTDSPELLNLAARNLKAKDPTYRNTDTTGMSAHAASGFALALMLERVMDSKHVFQAVARHLANVPGRKNFVWVTTSFPLRFEDYDFTPDMEQAARALNDANVAVYAVDARGLIGALSGGTGIANAETGLNGERLPPGFQMGGRGPGAGPSGVETMNLLAGRTGGDVYINSNGIEDSMRSAVEDAGLTYTLGFYPTGAKESSRDRDAHNLRVKVNRGGVDVRYRRNYTALNASVAVERPTLQQLIEDPLDATQIGITAEASRDPSPAGSKKVRVSVDVRDVKLERHDATWVGAVSVGFFIEGSKDFRVIPLKVDISADKLAEGLEKGIAAEAPIAAQNGTLRIVVQDQATGAAGSLRLPLQEGAR